MGYLVLARKWRPQGFDDLIGQQPIVRILTNSIIQNKIVHAYIFSGPRGVGKTSTARILAKALNCEKGPTPTPCGSCTFCTSITDGHSIDVTEIDGASNTGVDDVRDLRERVKYAPAGGRYKVYIIDESHMLSTQAFNALLKTLEEPPAHVVFVLATTEPRKIPLTVMSRCQHLPFKRVSTHEIKERLRHIAGSEGMNISNNALGMIARAADGSIRDSLTILDQVASFSAEINESDVKGLLAITDFTALSDMADAVIEGNREQILQGTAELVDRGTDLKALTKNLIKFFRDLLVAKFLPTPAEVLDVSEEEFGSLKSMAEKVSEEHLALILSELIKAESDVRTSFSPRVALEMSLIKISYLSMFKPLKEAIAALTNAAAGETDEARLLQQDPLDTPVETAIPENPIQEEPRDTDTRKQDPLDTPVETVIPEDSLQKETRNTNTRKGPLPPPLSGESLLKSIIDGIEDSIISSKLEKATPELKDDTLTLTFNSSEADICAKPIRDNSEYIGKIASDVRGAPTKIEINVKAGRTPSKKDLKEKAMSEPVIKEALDLFDGMVIDVRLAEES